MRSGLGSSRAIAVPPLASGGQAKLAKPPRGSICVYVLFLSDTCIVMFSVPGRSKSPSFAYRTRLRLFSLGLLAIVTGLSVHQILRSPGTEPQAILVLGGAPEREVFAADLAQQHPNLPIWVSSGSNPEYAEWVFDEANIDRDLVHLDYAAVDTVTNFTTLVDRLHSQGIHSVYLVTSDYHMRRAQVIGQIVLGSRGIQFQPIAIPTGETPEPIDLAVRDGARAIVWLVTGKTGSSLKDDVKESTNGIGIRLQP